MHCPNAKNLLLFVALFLFLALSVCWSHVAVSQEPLPDKYALLVGVTNYARPELNTGLKFPEKDASDIAALLRAAGFQVDLLLGKQATKAAIKARLGTFSQRGKNDGVIFVGLFGHGTEFADTKHSYFCPNDTAMKATRDKDGKALFNNDGTTKMDFVADSMLAIYDVLVAFGDSLAANRILVADCCRDDPNRARGRSFGSSLAPDKLPIQTLMLLGCSSQERSLERDEWGHGALTKCLLDQMQLAQSSQRTMGSIAEEVIPAVKRLVASNNNGNDKQTPRMLQTGRVEILLSSDDNTNPAEFTNSIGMVLKRILKGEFDMGSSDRDLQESAAIDMGFSERELQESAEILSELKMEFGKSEQPQHRVAITRNFYLGEGEVTQGQFEKVMGFNPSCFSAKGDGKDLVSGVNTHNLPVERVTWFDAVMFCNRLSESEGRQIAYAISDINKDGDSIKSATVQLLENRDGYRLPTEAQWEYACRAGTRTPFSFGKSLTSAQANFGQVNGLGMTRSMASVDNDFGLRDMHGNVWEWCWDNYARYDETSVYDETSERAPVRPIVVDQVVYRGGCWSFGPAFCRSAFRNGSEPGYREYNLGFRVSLVSSLSPVTRSVEARRANPN
jgi:formylglycine-generating enzyme required for sulfatase activity